MTTEKMFPFMIGLTNIFEKNCFHLFLCPIVGPIFAGPRPAQMLLKGVQKMTRRELLGLLLRSALLTTLPACAQKDIFNMPKEDVRFNTNPPPEYPKAALDVNECKKDKHNCKYYVVPGWLRDKDGNIIRNKEGEALAFELVYPALGLDEEENLRNLRVTFKEPVTADKIPLAIPSIWTTHNKVAEEIGYRMAEEVKKRLKDEENPENIAQIDVTKLAEEYIARTEKISLFSAPTLSGTLSKPRTNFQAVP